MRTGIAALGVAVTLGAAACTSSGSAGESPSGASSPASEARLATSPERAALKVEGTFEHHSDLRYVCTGEGRRDFTGTHGSGDGQPTATAVKRGSAWVVTVSFRGAPGNRYLVRKRDSGFCVDRQLG